MASPHPLQGAFDRVDRAADHLADFEERQTTFGNFYHHNLVLEHDSNPPHRIIMRDSQQVVLESVFGVLVGEIIYNLRAALDYLVYELALKDSGTVQNGTQFPICDTKSGFDGTAGKFLAGVNDAHRAAIEDLQPYSGCGWTATLRDISNPDKHRKLTAPAHSFAIRVSSLPNNALGRDLGFATVVRSVRRINRPSGEEVDMYLATEAPVILEVGARLEPILILMKELLVSVRGTLEAFKPRF